MKKLLDNKMSLNDPYYWATTLPDCKKCGGRVWIGSNRDDCAKHIKKGTLIAITMNDGSVIIRNRKIVEKERKKRMEEWIELMEFYDGEWK